MGKIAFPIEMGKIYFSKFYLVSLKCLISLYATSAFMESKISALTWEFLSVQCREVLCVSREVADGSEQLLCFLLRASLALQMNF